MNVTMPLFPVGSVSRSSFEMVVCWRTFDVSTSGDSPVTVIVSSRAPTCISALTFAVKPAGSWMPSRLKVLKPASVKVTE
jgi:hypothetical protein